MDLHSGSPFWPIRDGLPAVYPALHRRETADVAIVGAGITGALLAYELTWAGIDVIVLERDDVAAGSTAATSGLLLYDTDSSLDDLAQSVGRESAARVYRLGLEAIDRIEALCSTLSRRCGFHRRPSLYLASRRRDVRPLVREHDGRRAIGLDVALLDRRALEARYSFSAPAAIYSRGPGEIDCYRFAHALLEAASAAGARVYDRTRVTRLSPSPGGISVTTARGHAVTARRVIWATGYDVGLRLPRQMRFQLASTWAFVSEPLDSFTGWEDRCLIWETARPYTYIRSTDDGRLLAGGEDEPWPQKHRRGSVLEDKTAKLFRRTRTMFPCLPLEPAYAWAGTFATTEDGLPYIGELPGYPGIWTALGYGGNGITFSVIAARILRDAFLGQPHPDGWIFSFDRANGRRRRSR